MKVIETNLFYDISNIKDHQSRVIRVTDWEDYVKQFVEYNGSAVGRNTISIFGSLRGATIPERAKISNLTFDNTHLMCDVELHSGRKNKKLAYLIG